MTKETTLYARTVADQVTGGILQQTGLADLEPDPGQLYFHRLFDPDGSRKQQVVSEEIVYKYFAKKMGIQPTDVRIVFTTLEIAMEGRGLRASTDRHHPRNAQRNPVGTSNSRKNSKIRIDSR